MHKALVLIAILLCGCETQPSPNAYSHGAADRVLGVMRQCADAIARAPVPLNDTERDWHYQRCLVQNNATI